MADTRARDDVLPFIGRELPASPSAVQQFFAGSLRNGGSKLQAPNPKENPIFNNQKERVVFPPLKIGGLRFPWSLGLGVWDLLPNWTVWKCWSTNDAQTMGATKIYFIVFGVLTIAGGIIGYVKANSVPSIVAGSITGILLVAAAFLLSDHQVAGLALGLIVSLFLAGQFIPKFIRTGKAMPAGMMSILSVVGIVMAVLAWMKK
jgi:uncharacterized membrane protein (UPF0136 family)